MRSAAAVAVLALVLTSCGLTTLGRPAVAPDPPAQGAGFAALRLADPPAEPSPAIAAPAAAAPVQTPLQKASASEPEVVAKTTAAAADLGDVKHLWQTLNNCGPASVVMALSTFGVDADQETARLALRGPDVRRGMSPVPVDPWVQQLYGLRSIWRNNGTEAEIKALISNGFAPMVTQWMVDPEIERVAHWRTIVGYDDAKGVFYTNDPMRGRYVPLTYAWFDRNWQPFSYRYLVIYRPADEALLKAIVGPDWSERTMRQRFYERTKAEALERQDSASWLVHGEASYQNGMFAEAVAAFERGLGLGSAQGVFTLRSSYPQALRALGRDQEAAAAQQRLGGISAVPSSTVATPPDSFALQLAQERVRPEAARITE